MPGATVYGHAYAEAFMLMLYRCPCGRDEIIWNSEDQVTPFVVTCRCGGSAQHVDWNRDVYAPDFVPGVGSKVFVPANPEQLLHEWRQRVEEYWDHHEYPMRDHPSLGPLGKDGAAAELAKQSMADPTPALVEVTEPLQQRFACRLGGQGVSGG